MKASSDVCTCASPVPAEEKRRSALCPVCGKRREKVVALSDSLIEATFEILAEEGAIWSGAR